LPSKKAIRHIIDGKELAREIRKTYEDGRS